MANPVRKLDRARRSARRFSADARAETARARRRLDEKVRTAVEAACDEVDAAAEDGDATRLSQALRALDALWVSHLERLGKPAWRQYLEVVVAAVILALLLRAVVVEGCRISSAAMAPTLLPGDHVLVSRLAYGVPVPFTRWRLGGDRPRRGDVVAIESPRAPGVEVVTRVVGLPGDLVELRDGVLRVNGVPQPRTPDGDAAPGGRGEGGAPSLAACRRFHEALARGTFGPGAGDDPGQVEARWQAAATAGVANHAVLECRSGGLAGREGARGVVAPGHLAVLGDRRDGSDDGDAGAWQVPQDRVKGRATRVYFSWGEGGAVFGRGPRLGRLLGPVE